MGMLPDPLTDFELWLLGIAGALIGILIGSIIWRSNARLVAKRKSHSDNISKCVTPFKDAIANIHLGENNQIFIMNSFFRSQKDAIAIFKSQCIRKNTAALQKAWNEYEKYYTVNAKGIVAAQFETVPQPFKTREYEILHKYLSSIIKEVEKT